MVGGKRRERIGVRWSDVVLQNAVTTGGSRDIDEAVVDQK
jgi:hypothetical protein